MLAFARIDPCELIEISDLTRNLHRQITRVKARDALYPAFSREYRAAECIFSNSVWAYYTHTSNDGAFGHRFGPSVPIVCRGMTRCRERLALRRTESSEAQRRP